MSASESDRPWVSVSEPLRLVGSGSPSRLALPSPVSLARSASDRSPSRTCSERGLLASGASASGLLVREECGPALSPVGAGWPGRSERPVSWPDSEDRPEPSRPPASWSASGLDPSRALLSGRSASARAGLASGASVVSCAGREAFVPVPSSAWVPLAEPASPPSAGTLPLPARLVPASEPPPSVRAVLASGVLVRLPSEPLRACGESAVVPVLACAALWAEEGARVSPWIGSMP
ncbi:hypothetical protein SAMN05216355_10474 [Actinomyces ruminicola]|uniref:Uncharacterized protein n=1 Tax=Actinomyces ruminicola TaxID=332524 RepID=A0A1H0BJB3_9ACTO|nr:hypothetical protein SAMN05216355_10474 [Actinomyces ruminicola]